MSVFYLKERTLQFHSCPKYLKRRGAGNRSHPLKGTAAEGMAVREVSFFVRLL